MPELASSRLYVVVTILLTLGKRRFELRIQRRNLAMHGLFRHLRICQKVLETGTRSSLVLKLVL